MCAGQRATTDGGIVIVCICIVFHPIPLPNTRGPQKGGEKGEGQKKKKTLVVANMLYCCYCYCYCYYCYCDIVLLLPLPGLVLMRTTVRTLHITQYVRGEKVRRRHGSQVVCPPSIHSSVPLFALAPESIIWRLGVGSFAGNYSTNACAQAAVSRHAMMTICNKGGRIETHKLVTGRLIPSVTRPCQMGNSPPPNIYVPTI